MMTTRMLAFCFLFVLQFIKSRDTVIAIITASVIMIAIATVATLLLLLAATKKTKHSIVAYLRFLLWLLRVIVTVVDSLWDCAISFSPTSFPNKIAMAISVDAACFVSLLLHLRFIFFLQSMCVKITNQFGRECIML